MTTSPFASTPWTWKTFFARSRPTRVDSELTCPVLVAHQMSASSGSVLLWDCGQRLGVVHISTGTPPSGFNLKTAVDRREAAGFCDFARCGCIRLARAAGAPEARGH